MFDTNIVGDELLHLSGHPGTSGRTELSRWVNRKQLVEQQRDGKPRLNKVPPLRGTRGQDRRHQPEGRQDSESRNWQESAKKGRQGEACDRDYQLDPDPDPDPDPSLSDLPTCGHDHRALGRLRPCLASLPLLRLKLQPDFSWRGCKRSSPHR